MSIKTKLSDFMKSGGIGRFIKRYGAVTAVVGCAVIVGVVYTITWNSGNSVNPPSTQETTPAPQSYFPLMKNPSKQLIDVEITMAPVVQSTAAATRIPQVTATAKPDTGVSQEQSVVPQMLRPVEGEIVGEFARDALVYSETLRQWSTHPAVDITAAEGDPVVAVLDGEVTEVFQDELMGICVRVSHGDDMESLYAGLKQANVEVGRTLNQGDMLGLVGATAISETALGDHLHFEFLIKDEPVNPVPYFVDK